jgi:hypothetical protein
MSIAFWESVKSSDPRAGEMEIVNEIAKTQRGTTRRFIRDLSGR